MRKSIIALTLREQDRIKVQKLAKQQERSVSELLRKVIEDWLEQQQK
jgi:hypothetical protein